MSTKTERELTNRHMDWYAAWRALSFCKSLLQVRCQGEPDMHEICRLLSVGQYMCRLNTIAVDSEGVDAGLMNGFEDEVMSEELLVEILENPKRAQEILETVDLNEEFED